MSLRRTLVIGGRLAGVQVVGKTSLTVNGALDENKRQATPVASGYAEAKRRAGTSRSVGVISCGEGDPKARQRFLLAAEGKIIACLAAAQNGRIPESSYLPLDHHLHRPRNNTKLPMLLRLPKSHLQNRSKARSEAGLIEGQSRRPGSTTSHRLDSRYWVGASVLPACILSRAKRLGTGSLAKRCDVSGQIQSNTS